LYAIGKTTDPTVLVSKEYNDKHAPEIGGYYVLYDDGYESWSPAAAFESGYTLVSKPDASCDK
jgi:hypothetical protein